MPVPAAGEVLIKVAAAGVNRPDVFQRLGRYPPPPGASDIPGLEVAGTVEQLGAGVRDWRVGDAVCALVTGGGYAEYCVAPAPQCLPVPRGTRSRRRRGASRKPSSPSGPTSSSADACRPASRCWSTAARAASARPRSSSRARAARACSRPRDRRRSARPASGSAPSAPSTTARPTSSPSVRELTGGRGVDVVLDMVGGEYFARNIDVLAIEGRLVEIATLHGVKAELNIQTIMQRRLTITGSTLRPRPVADKGAIAAARPRARVAAARIGRGEADRARDLSAARRRRGAPRDGVERAHRQARAGCVEQLE